MPVVQQRLPITLILFLAATLYLFGLGTESLWIDELFSIEDAQTGNGLPPSNLTRPIYYILLKGWMQFGTSDAWLRGLSVLFGLCSIFLIYQLGRRLAGEKEAWLAALMLTLSPLFINHAQEVRMYTLSTCVTLGGTLALTYAFERPIVSRIGYWAVLRLLSILCVPLNIAMLVPDVLLICLKFCRQRRILLKFGIWLLFIGALWMPCVFSVAQATSSHSGEGHVSRRSVPDFMEAVRLVRSFTVLPRFHSSRPVLLSSVASVFYKAFTAALIGLMGLAIFQKHRSSKLLWATAWGFLPLALIFTFSNLFFSLWMDRYLLFTLPYLLILIAAGFTQVLHRWSTAALLMACIYFIAVGGGLVRYYTVLERGDLRGIAQTINFHEEPGDAIALALRRPRQLTHIDHYYQGNARIDILGGVPDGKAIQTSDINAWLDELPTITSRLWLVCALSDVNTKIFRAAVATEFDVQLRRRFWYGMPIDVILVEPLETSTQEPLNRQET